MPLSKYNKHIFMFGKKKTKMYFGLSIIGYMDGYIDGYCCYLLVVTSDEDIYVHNYKFQL